eukprot:s4114_g7.t1
MSRVAKLWKTLTEAEKAPYKEKSTQEFQAQRDALMRMGLDPRPRAGVGPWSRVDASMVHMPLEATGKEAKKAVAAFFFFMLLKSATAKWERLRDQWRSRFPLDPQDPSAGSWLQARKSPWGVGCKACHECGCESSFASFGVKTEAALQLVNFQKHANNRHHKAAVESYLLGDVDAAGINSSPSKTEFLEILGRIKKGQPTWTLNKEKRLTWCLAEALKTLDQRSLEEASAIGLYRDERNGRVLVRCRAVSKNLEVHSFVLGQERFGGTGARNLTTATASMFKRACAKCLAPTGEKDEKNEEWEGQIIIALDILTTIRLLPMDQYPSCRLMTAMPQMSAGQRLPLTDFTKKEFQVAIRVISVLECVPEQFSNFTWSKLREEWFEDMFKKLQASLV